MSKYFSFNLIISFSKHLLLLYSIEIIFAIQGIHQFFSNITDQDFISFVQE